MSTVDELRNGAAVKDDQALVNYRAPAKSDDVLEARIAAGRIGNTSFTLHLEFYRHGKGVLVAEADITYVLIRPSKMAKAPIPDSVRELLEKGAPGVLVSHAGESPGGA